MLLTITPFYAGLLGLLYLALTFRVVGGRVGKGAPSLGDGGNHAMFRAIRGHANFNEYVPLILLMMAMLEVGGVFAPWCCTRSASRCWSAASATASP
ncbi:MAG TPA: MAPEG family protein [Dokdonella sp.]